MDVCVNDATKNTHKLNKEAAYKSIKKITSCNDFYDLNIIK